MPRKKKSSEETAVDTQKAPKAEEIQEKPESEKKNKKSKIPFEAWFAQKLASKHPKIKTWRINSIKTFLGKQGLGDWEEIKEFDKALSRY